MEDIALQSLQIFLLLCYVRKLLTLSAQKFADFAISSTHYNISQPNFRFLLFLIGSFREFRGGGGGGDARLFDSAFVFYFCMTYEKTVFMLFI